MRVAVVTGASRGLGLALARGLATRGWSLVIDARGDDALAAAAEELSRSTTTVALAGDVTAEAHLRAMVSATEDLGGIDLLVNNAGILGASPPPKLEDYPVEVLERVFHVNVLAPLRLFQLCATELERARGCVVNITSEAAVEPFAEWGGYGSSKAALDQLSAVMAVEHPALRIYWVDPGDLNTQMEQEGWPGQDVSDRPDPEFSVPGFLALIEGGSPSGRYRAQHMRARARGGHPQV